VVTSANMFSVLTSLHTCNFKSKDHSGCVPFAITNAPLINCALTSEYYILHLIRRNDRLIINRYVKDILTNTSPSIEQVTIEPDGSWHVPKPKTEEPKPTPSAPRETSFIGDEDLMIAQPNAPGSSRATETPNRFYGASLAGSSIAGSRETSIMPGSATSRSGAGTKRAAPETIDLTLSDDDEPAPPPTKRQNTGSSNLAQPWLGGDYSY
jgi:hypothetical protein